MFGKKISFTQRYSASNFKVCPDLAKFCQSGTMLTVLGKFLIVYFLFGKFFNMPVVNLISSGVVINRKLLIFVTVESQITII